MDNNVFVFVIITIFVTLIMTTFLVFSRMAAVNDAAYYMHCKEAGGIPYIGRTYNQCLHPSAIINLKEK